MQETQEIWVWSLGPICESGGSPGVGNGNLVQCYCLKNPMDRRAWRATVHGTAKSWTWRSMHFTLHLVNFPLSFTYACTVLASKKVTWEPCYICYVLLYLGWVYERKGGVMRKMWYKRKFYLGPNTEIISKFWGHIQGLRRKRHQ